MQQPAQQGQPQVPQQQVPQQQVPQQQVPQVYKEASFDAATLHNAMKGLGTDEAKMIEVLAHRTADQIKQIRAEFDKQFMKNGKDLIKWIEDDTSGNFKRTLTYLAKGPAETKADYIFDAIDGLGTKEKVLIDVLTQSSNQEIEEMKAIYAKKYGLLTKTSAKRTPGQSSLQPQAKFTPNKLEYDVRDDTSGDFQKLLITLIRAKKDESLTVNEAAAEKDADELYNKGEGKIGTDDDFFIQVFSLRSNLHLQAVDKYYRQKHGKPLIEAVKKETSFYFKDTLIALSKPREVYLAERFNEAVKGLGTNDRLLVYLMSVHDKPLLKRVADAYLTLYKKPLVDDISGDTSGDYRKLLVSRLS